MSLSPSNESIALGRQGHRRLYSQEKVREAAAKTDEGVYCSSRERLDDAPAT